MFSLNIAIGACMKNGFTLLELLIVAARNRKQSDSQSAQISAHIM
ncbi:prepilin-type N-terminal cleavage/methylation domain-containing protein [Vibrio navarrensis]